MDLRMALAVVVATASAGNYRVCPAASMIGWGVEFFAL
jgi:hypothetical protein